MMFNYNHDQHPYFQYEYKLYPTREQQKSFVNSYLTTYSETRKVEFDEADEEKLINEANNFALASHLFWAIWCFNMSSSSSIEFDYLVSIKLKNVMMQYPIKFNSI